jgi:DNA anti-recombination protein RmuC
MRRHWWWGIMVMTLSATTVAAQQPDDAGPADGPRAQELRQRIEDRFALRVKEELGLSDEQTQQLRATATTYGSRRRDLQAQERQLRSALAAQLRPGVAANQDSVSRLTDALVDLRSRYARTFQDENQEMGKYLTPVQRSRLFVMRERLVRRIQEVRARRQEERDGEVSPEPRRFRERPRPLRGRPRPER